MKKRLKEFIVALIIGFISGVTLSILNIDFGTYQFWVIMSLIFLTSVFTDAMHSWIFKKD